MRLTWPSTSRVPEEADLVGDGPLGVGTGKSCDGGVGCGRSRYKIADSGARVRAEHPPRQLRHRHRHLRPPPAPGRLRRPRPHDLGGSAHPKGCCTVPRVSHTAGRRNATCPAAYPPVLRRHLTARRAPQIVLPSLTGSLSWGGAGRFLIAPVLPAAGFRSLLPPAAGLARVTLLEQRPQVGHRIGHRPTGGLSPWSRTGACWGRVLPRCG
jgi:hypothetical protein